MLTYTKGTSELWGDPKGGAPFDYGSVEEALYLQRRLSWLLLRGDKKVHRIEFKYRDIHGGSPPISHGGKDGTDSIPLSFDSDEYISCIDADIAQRVERLEIKTTRGATISAGSSGGTGKHKAFGPDARVLGFQGRAGYDLDAIQLVHVCFFPAKFRARKGIRRG